MDIVVGIVSSLVAACILGVLTHLFRTGRLKDWWDQFRAMFTSTIDPSSQDRRPKPNVIRRMLVLDLVRDQNRSGTHYGQFGINSTAKEAGRFHTGSEDLSLKPRLYLTAWPTLILASRGLARRPVAFAIRGVRRLFNGNRIFAYQAAAHQNSPIYQSRLITYRHTMCGALLLYRVCDSDPIVKSVLDGMLDKENRWQNPDGGWAQCDREHTDSDLWGSAYAAQMLDLALTRSSEMSNQQKALAEASLIRTLNYLRDAWNRDMWKFGGSPAQENSILMLIEIGSILIRRDPKLRAKILEQCNRWLSPLGYLSEKYIEDCSPTSNAALSTRFAFAFYKLGIRKEQWIQLYETVVDSPKQTLNSADTAFLLELSFIVAHTANS